MWEWERDLQLLQQEYRRENREYTETDSENTRLWKREHPDKVAEYQRKYRSEHPEETRKQWAKDTKAYEARQDPEKLRESQRRRVKRYEEKRKAERESLAELRRERIRHKKVERNIPERNMNIRTWIDDHDHVNPQEEE